MLTQVYTMQLKNQIHEDIPHFTFTLPSLS